MDKYSQIIDIAENPGKYSEIELTEILSDPESREIYNALCDADSALKRKAHLTETQVEQEWASFANSTYHDAKGNYKKRKLIPSLLGSRVAAVAAITITSVAALAIGLGVINKPIKRATVIPNQEIKTNPGVADAGIKIANDTVIAQDSISRPIETIIFENEPLKNILTYISEYYGLKLESHNPNAEKLRLYFNWDQAKEADDVIRQLNQFGKITIIRKDGKLILK